MVVVPVFRTATPTCRPEPQSWVTVQVTATLLVVAAWLDGAIPKPIMSNAAPKTAGYHKGLWVIRLMATFLLQSCDAPNLHTSRVNCSVQRACNYVRTIDAASKEGTSTIVVNPDSVRI